MSGISRRRRLLDGWQKAFGLARDTYRVWQADHVGIHAAALAYFVIFSLAPILLILIGILSLWLEQENAQELLLRRLYMLIGVQEGLSLVEMLDGLRHPDAPLLTTLFEAGLVIVGASNLFSHLRFSLNRIWGILPHPRLNRFKFMLRKRLIGLAILLGTGILFLLSVILSTSLSAFRESRLVGIPYTLELIDLGNRLLGYLFTWGLFAIIFKILPDAETAWKDVSIGAIITTVLFYLGQAAVGVYFRVVDFGSGYGAASSLIVLLVWVFYIAQIFYFGAEFVKVYANTYGSGIHPLVGTDPSAPGKMP